MKFLYVIVCFCCLYATPVRGQSIDVKHVALELQFDWQKKRAFGQAEITASVLQTGDKIHLDAGYLTINSIASNGKKLAFTYAGGDADDGLAIVLDKTYRPDERFTLQIDYHTNYENRADPSAIGGSFGKGLRFFQPTSATPQKRRQIWSAGEPEGNKYWFPCNEDIADIHTFSITATLEKPLMLISNGRLQQATDNQNNTISYTYRIAAEIPNYLISIAVGEYASVTQKTRRGHIRTYCYPHEKAATASTVELLPDMMRFLEEKTGRPYPLEQYAQVVVQDYPFPGGVGQNAAALLSDNYVDDEGVHKDFKYLWDGVAVQALANQWFGNLLMPKSWSDIWLNNAFGEYFAGLYTAKDNAKEEYLTWYYPFEKSGVVGDWNAGNRRPIVPPEMKDVAVLSTDNYSKLRGALVLRMLHHEMGDRQWWKAVQHYVKTYAGQQVDTKDFQRSVEKTAGKSYQWFFDQWVYTIGLPRFEVKKSYDAAQKRLTLTVRQTQSQENKTAYPQTAYFEGKIDIEIDDKIKSVYLKPQAVNTFHFPAAAQPRLVHFNVAETLLCETTVFEKTTDEYLYQLQNSRDVLAKQAALDTLMQTANDAGTSAALKARIVEVVMAEVRSNHYWRYRWYALRSLQQVLAPPYDELTIAFLIETIQKEKSWIKSTAVNMLGAINDAKYKHLYINALDDDSDRVVNAAAVALGRTKSADAFDHLMGLEHKKSWKNQNRISALNGLRQLGDVRAADYALRCVADNQSPRWYLATPVWDYPFAAVNTLVALGKADLAYPILLERLKKSLDDNDVNDIFQQVQLVNLLKDARAKEMYALLKEKFKDDAAMLEAVKNYEKDN